MWRIHRWELRRCAARIARTRPCSRPVDVPWGIASSLIGSLPRLTPQRRLVFPTPRHDDERRELAPTASSAESGSHLAHYEPVQLAAPRGSETPPLFETGPGPFNSTASNCCVQPAVELRDAQRGPQRAQLYERGPVCDVERLEQKAVWHSHRPRLRRSGKACGVGGRDVRRVAGTSVRRRAWRDIQVNVEDADAAHRAAVSSACPAAGAAGRAASAATAPARGRSRRTHRGLRPGPVGSGAPGDPGTPATAAWSAWSTPAVEVRAPCAGSCVSSFVPLPGDRGDRFSPTVTPLATALARSRRAMLVSRRVRRRSDEPPREPPAASREQVVRLGQLVAPRRRPCDEARALQLEQRPQRVRAVRYEVRLVTMRERDARRAQPGRPEANAQYAERLRVQAGRQTAKVLAHDPERKPPETAAGDGRVKRVLRP
jgi:hypothetical protein